MSKTPDPSLLKASATRPHHRPPIFSQPFQRKLLCAHCLILYLLSIIVAALLWGSLPHVKDFLLSKLVHVFYPNHAPSPKLYNETPRPDWSYRQRSVKEAFLHAYTAYKEYAFPTDEYLPLSGKGCQNFNGWGVTVVDSMDTMYLMGLHDEFKDAVDFVSMMTFDMNDDQYAHFSETVIHYLGGLLSAYALSKDPVLLQKADELGTKLLPAFNTRSKLPARDINTVTAAVREDKVRFNDIASFQLEYRYLAHLTGNTIYYEVADNVNIILETTQDLHNHSLWNSFWDTSENYGQKNSSYTYFSVGQGGDSGYEYLLKQYLQTNKTESRLKKMYAKSTQGVIENLVRLSSTRDLLYVSTCRGKIPLRNFDHSSCFFPGLLTLGSAYLEIDSITSEADKHLHRWVAEGIAHTCYAMYAETPSGLSPSVVYINSPDFSNILNYDEVTGNLWIDYFRAWNDSGGSGKLRGVFPLARLIPPSPLDIKKNDYTPVFDSSYQYHMRPETVESMYVMWKTTKDPIWRERGWEIFKSIERNCRLRAGYASIANVERKLNNNIDDMPSFFLAETLKYLYLLFSPEETFSLESWVFNTGGHPLPVFGWSDEERGKYGIHN